MNFAIRQSINIFITGLFILIIAITVFYKLNYDSILNYQLDESKTIAKEISKHIDRHLIDDIKNTKRIGITPIIEKTLSASNKYYQSLSKKKRDKEIQQNNEKWKSIKDKNNTFILNYMDNNVAKYLKSLQLNTEDEYGEIFLTNKYGALVASTAKLTTFAHAHKYWWQGAYNEGNGAVFLDDRGYDDSVEGYVLGIVIPIKKDNEIIGILKANLNIIGSISRIINDSQIKNHQKLKLIRSGGLIVFEEGLEPLSKKISDKLLKKIKHKSNEAFIFDSKKEKLIVGLAKITISSEMEGYKFGGNFESIDHKKGNTGESWLILDFNPLSNIITQTKSIISNLWIIGILLTLAIAIISLLLGKRTTKPLNELLTQIERISKGDYGLKIITHRKDEIGKLATAFNQMSDYLKESTTSVAKLNNANQQLATSEEKFRYVLSNSVMTIYNLNLNTGTYDYLSPAVKEMYGYSVEEFISGGLKGSIENFHPDDVKKIENHLEKLLSQKVEDFTPTVEYRFNHPKLGYRWISDTRTIIFNENGKAISLVGCALDITERKLAEQALKASEEKFRNQANFLNAVTENSPFAMWISDAEGTMIRANQALRDILNITDDMILGKYNVLKDDNLRTQGVLSEVKSVFDDLKSTRFEIFWSSSKTDGIDMPDTKNLWLDASFYPIVDDTGKLSNVICQYVGITKRKIAEKNLIIEQKKLNHILESIPYGIYIVNQERDIQYINPVIRNEFGTINNRKCYEYFHNRNTICPWCKNEVFSGKSVEWEWFSFKNNRYYQLFDTPIKNLDGTIAKMELFHDITESKKKEKEISKLSTAVKQSPSIIVITDLKGNIEYANPKFTEITGYKFEEVKNKNPKVLGFSNSSNQIFKELWKTISSGKEWQGEFHNKKKNGERYWERALISPIFDSENKIINYLKIAEDITEKKKIETELLKMEKLRSIGTLAGGIAHDFNNVLTGIYGNISLALMKLEENHQSYHFLTRAENSLNRATQLTQQLLTFSKGGNPIKRDENLSKIIKETVTFDLSGSNVKPIFNFADNLYSIKVDKGQLQQVFSNLAINADQASPDGGHLYISIVNSFVNDNEILYLASGKYLKITVQDEGTGIPQKHIDKIFEPYFTTKPTGNGLGLATTYSIIKKHKGHLEIDSKLGKGTKFTLYLPASKKGEVKKEEKSETSRLPENSIAKILIMDDEEIIREILSQMIELLGYKTDSVSDGKEAIGKYIETKEQENPFDIVIMDLTIPGGMGGKKAVKEILKIDKDAKVIVSSGYASGATLADYKSFGFINMINKPYTIAKLEEVLNEVMSNHKNI